MEGKFKSVLPKALKNTSFCSSMALMFYLSFLLMSPSGHAQGPMVEQKIEDAVMVEKMTAIVTIKGKVAFEGTARRIELNISIPSNNSWQKVLKYDRKCRLIRDEEGNVICNLVAREQSGAYAYSLEFEVEVNRFRLKDETLEIRYEADVERYLQPTSNIQSDDILIKELAENITRNAGDEFDKIALLAKWVHDTVEYDERYADRNEDALWVLKNKRGVCAEYTTLFIALARAIGIPARYSHVYAYGENGWESHAIAEVYLGKWVPVDVLWMEIGWVDATHIFFGSYLDNQVTSHVEVSGYNVKNVVWKEDELEIVALNVKYGKKEYVELFIPKQNLGFGDSSVLAVEISSDSYGAEYLKLVPCKSNGAKVIDVQDTGKFLTYRPGIKKYAYWLIKASEALDPNYIYSCPLVLSLMFDQPKNRVIQVNVSYYNDHEFSWDARVMKDYVNLGETQRLNVNIKKVKKESRLFVGYRTFLKTYEYSSGNPPDVLEIEYKPEKKGTDSIVVFDDAGNAVKLYYEVKERKYAYMENILAPKYVRLGSNSSARVVVINQNRMAGLKLEYEGTTMNIPAERNTSLFVPLDTTKPGKRYLKVRLILPQENVADEEILQYEVIMPVVIQYRGMVKERIANELVTGMEFYSTGVCKKVDILDGEGNLLTSVAELKEGENRIYLNTSKRLDRIMLKCYDLSGKEIHAEFNLKQKVMDRLFALLWNLINVLNKHFGG